FKRSAGFVNKSRLALHAVYSTEARKRISGMIDDFKPDVAHVRNIYHHLTPSILWELKSRGVPVLYHVNDFKLICPNYNLISSSGDVCERCKDGRFWNVIREGCYAGGTAASTVLAAEAYFHRWISTYEKCVDLILAPSYFVKQKLIDNGTDCARGRIEVLPHLQNCPSQVAPPPGTNAPILYFGRLSAEKGVDDLLLAMERLPNIRLIIAGDGPQRSALEALARTLRLNNVRFAGHVTGTALSDLIANSQFTVFPSRAYETMGKSILESYAQGRAVVASDLGSRRELVDDGRTGVLYKVKDVGQLSAAIGFLRARPQLAQEMGAAGRAVVQERHSQDQHFEVLERIYSSLAKPKVAPSKFLTSRSAIAQIPEAPRLRIAFIGGRGVIGKYSGIETCYEELGAKLAEMGHEVTAYCRSYFTPKSIGYRGIRIVRLPTIRTKHLETLIHTLLSTIHACFSRCDVVQYYTLGPSLFSFLPRLFGKKTVVTVQGLDWQRKKWGWVARRALKFCEWTSARLPNATAVVSHTLEKYYREHYAKGCSYVPNGTRIRECHGGDFLQSNALEPGGYALFLGRFSPEKNCHLLIEAFEKCNTSMKLVLAGGSSHTDYYVARLRERQSEKIKVLDWLSGNALEELLTNAALFVLPSDMEGLSLALLDAMGAGVCVLASGVAENVEAMGEGGFTFRAGSVNDLQRMLTTLLSDRTLRQSTGRRAQERVRKNYLWEEVAKKMEAVYLDLFGWQTSSPAVPAKAVGKAA
ncbi:MAG TPA: glycosyltransferase family 4 protein, partial [Terriglobales bacterium]|nr:glycosyltransferase family 4 protein [Terriglobales bacterium]